ncbi:SDR family oxidoreductase [Halococcus agarilyticus]|uniref:SDR family oxidoreductase n=1 Tax=Halococcus agarilyticus TaxID=1232219 RepID=UPI0006781D49|nr:SDR family oxidoreductase [Halococcus agarilyticus]
MSESTPESGTTGSSVDRSTGSAGQSDVVVITGATSGIGRATAREFGEDGACVGLLARGEDGLSAAKAEVEEAGGEALAIPTDVSEYEEVEAAADEIEAAFGPIDVWINNAMTTVYSSFLDLDPDEFERVTDVTYIGAVNGSRAALSRMTERDEGKLVQVGSALSYRGIPLQSAYCGSKFAMRGMNESLRTELLADDSDVDITMVQLPGLNTPQFEHCRSHLEDHPQPVPPIYQPEVAADGIHWAAYNRRRELYIGRATLKTIWGNKFVPWFVDRYLAWTAVDGQRSDLPYDPDRPENLYEPVDGDPGARGPFSGQATNVSQQLWLAKHRRHLGVALSAIVGLLALVGLSAGSDGSENG